MNLEKIKDLIEKNFIKSKNIWLAYLLAIFFGTFGLHRFYLKKKDNFISFYGDLPLVGHYINGFDIKFLIANNLIIKNISTIDTLPLARKLDLEDAKLPTVKKFLGINNNSHDSLDDCYTTNALYQFAKKNF